MFLFDYLFSFLYNYRTISVIAFYHTACSNEAVIANSCSTKDNRVGTNPAILADCDRSSHIFISAYTIVSIKHMVVIVDINPRTHYRIIANADLIMTHYHAVPIDANHLP